MDSIMLEGIQLTPLKIIPGDLGTIFHGLKVHESAFTSFGEAYFSTVRQGAIKGWKLHTKMISNIVVPIGIIRFVLYDTRPDSQSKGKFMDVNLSPNNYQRLTIPSGLWLAFQGIGTSENMLLNIASIPHDPTEALQLPLDNQEIPNFQW